MVNSTVKPCQTRTPKGPCGHDIWWHFAGAGYCKHRDCIPLTGREAYTAIQMGFFSICRQYIPPPEQTPSDSRRSRTKERVNANPNAAVEKVESRKSRKGKGK